MNLKSESITYRNKWFIIIVFLYFVVQPILIIIKGLESKSLFHFADFTFSLMIAFAMVLNNSYLTLLTKLWLASVLCIPTLTLSSISSGTSTWSYFISMVPMLCMALIAVVGTNFSVKFYSDRPKFKKSYIVIYYLVALGVGFLTLTTPILIGDFLLCLTEHMSRVCDAFGC